MLQPSKKKTKKKRQDIFFSVEYRLLVAKGPLFWIFRGWKIWSFWAKKLMEIWNLYITEKFLFLNFRGWETWFFLREKVDGKMIFTGYWKVLVLGYWKALVLNFSVMGNTIFFFSQNADMKIIFTWSFWALHDISGPEIFVFSRNDKTANC